jgi:predicted ATPase
LKTNLTSNRIVLTGASGVGKTSLAFLLGKELGLEVIPEVARELCHQMGYQSPTEIPDQQVFRGQVLDAQIAEENKRAALIADRCTIDAWVMWQRWQICSAMTYDTEAYYDKCRKQAQTYTHVIYIPPLFVAPDDAFRWTEPDYVKQVDRLTRMTLYDWALWDRTYTIQSADLESRVKEVRAWLSI